MTEAWTIILPRHQDEYWQRVQRLVLRPRSMTLRAAQIVVDAAMLSIGCTEGKVRTQIAFEQSVDKNRELLHNLIDGEEQREKSRRDV